MDTTRCPVYNLIVESLPVCRLTKICNDPYPILRNFEWRVATLERKKLFFLSAGYNYSCSIVLLKIDTIRPTCCIYFLRYSELGTDKLNTLKILHELIKWDLLFNVNYLFSGYVRFRTLFSHGLLRKAGIVLPVWRYWFIYLFICLVR